MPRKRVAVIGSGCSGLGALWALKSTNHEVHLFEANDRFGGHTNTVAFKYNGNETPVDTGFIVMNSATYPNFISFLKELDVPTVPTEMTFGVSRDDGLFEWAGTSLSSVFALRSNIFSLRMWRMIFDVLRFNLFALDLLREENKIEHVDQRASPKEISKSRQELSIGTYLEQNHYSDAFRDDYLIPMTAAVWSTSPDKCSLEFPAVTLIRFMWNHHLLTAISARPTWMTIPGGSKNYVDKVLKGFPEERLHLSTKVESIQQLQSQVWQLKTSEGPMEGFDHVILATHGDQALAILGENAAPKEQEILAGFTTNKNTAILHSDLSLMPKRRVAWSAWNYITKSSPTSANIDQVCLTYWMNCLQHISNENFGPVLVTLNPLHRPSPSLIQGEWSYSHPLYNASAIRSQSLLPEIQNARGISYAGAWTKYGFHEDGFSSGLKAAIEHLDAKIPWEFVDSTFSRGRSPVLTLKDRALRTVLSLIQAIIVSMIFLKWYSGQMLVRHKKVD